MAKFLGYEQCPKCAENGKDRSHDNLGIYSDGSRHCFSCGYHRYPKRIVKEEKHVDEDKAVLPTDFTREVPAGAWKWLLQWGLPYSYWKPYTGYSPKDERLVLTFGNPVRFSIGRYLGTDAGERGMDGRWIRRPPRKWFFYGDGHGYVDVLGNEKEGPTVLVEDLISAHKVAQVSPTICLFGTNVHDNVIKVLMQRKAPTILWLDNDQQGLLSKKLNKLQTFLKYPVRFINTIKDPKAYSLDEIKEILNAVS